MARLSEDLGFNGILRPGCYHLHLSSKLPGSDGPTEPSPTHSDPPSRPAVSSFNGAARRLTQTSCPHGFAALPLHPCNGELRWPTQVTQDVPSSRGADPPPPASRL